MYSLVYLSWSAKKGQYLQSVKHNRLHYILSTLYFICYNRFLSKKTGFKNYISFLDKKKARKKDLRKKYPNLKSKIFGVYLYLMAVKGKKYHIEYSKVNFMVNR